MIEGYQELPKMLAKIQAAIEVLPEAMDPEKRQALASLNDFSRTIEALFREESVQLTYRQVKETLDEIGDLLSRGSATSTQADKAYQILEEGIEAFGMFLSQVQEYFAEGTGHDQFEFALEEIRRQPRPTPHLRSRPLFIIAFRRSGTTLLSWLLDSHPNLASVPENFLCHSLLRTPRSNAYRTEFIRPLIVTAQLSLERFGEERSVFHDRIAALIDSVFSDYAARRNKKRWVAKELFINKSLDLLDLLFGYTAQYLFISRHGFDSALSAAQRFGVSHGAPSRDGGPNIKYFLEEWIENNELILDFVERNPERCHAIRYEDFVAEPEVTARGIFEFSGEPWHPTIFEDMQTQDHHRGLGDNKIFETQGKILTDRVDRWREWPDGLLHQLARMANPTLARLGYGVLEI